MLISRLIAVLSSRNIYENILVRGSLFRNLRSREDIENMQLEKFNKVWKDAYCNISFYSKWKENNKLPSIVRSLSELNKWPIVRKSDFQISKGEMLRKNIKPDSYLKTGGSTGEPLSVGTWNDSGLMASSLWLGRSAYGYVPGMKVFLLWGHHHLYGRGLKRIIKRLQRSVKDFICNYRRCSAYDLSEEAMTRAYNCMVAFRPECVIGFSASILAFCRVCQSTNKSLSVSPKVVICTAGPLTAAEKNEITRFFQAPVCMEYGSVECAVMGYSMPNTQCYNVFWDTHLIQGEIDDSGMTRAIITRLSKCYTPIIRYDIGDYIEVPNNCSSHLILNAVHGRPSDIVHLSNGVSFFGAIIGDCVKQVSSILSHQLRVFSNGIEIAVVSLKPLTKEEEQLIKQRLFLTVPSIGGINIKIIRVTSLEKTIGGKIPLVKIYDKEII